MQVCTRCVMDDNSDPTIIFLDDGTCNYCNEAMERLKSEYFPNSIGKKKLDAIMSKIKKDGLGKKYDCMVGVSGGVDSSYVLYLGHKYELRMLAVHVDDGLDTDMAIQNMNNLCYKTRADLVWIKPDLEQYKDLLRSFFLARVPNLALPQDNLLIAALSDAIRKYHIKYSLSGANFAHESILERSTGVNAHDKRHIKAVHKQYGRGSIEKLRMISFCEGYLSNRYIQGIKKVFPLNYIDYNLNKVLNDLAGYSNFLYYGGKHHESVLTRFLQCFYLPEKFSFDKRKSHFSSLIVSGQMTRGEALTRLQEDPYTSEKLKESDFNYIANYFDMTRDEFDALLSMSPKKHTDYSVSIINHFSEFARKYRRYLG